MRREEKFIESKIKMLLEEGFSFPHAKKIAYLWAKVRGFRVPDIKDYASPENAKMRPDRLMYVDVDVAYRGYFLSEFKVPLDSIITLFKQFFASLDLIAGSVEGKFEDPESMDFIKIKTGDYTIVIFSKFHGLRLAYLAKELAQIYNLPESKVEVENVYLNFK